jgi:nitrite reductase/ring-hydroxylating ferredoxin subunit
MTTNSLQTVNLVRISTLDELKEKQKIAITVQNHPIVIFYINEKIHAIRNQCPHMGFPLDRGTVKDGIITCHWHHAKFDLKCGGTFDIWADDVQTYPVELKENEVWINLRIERDEVKHQLKRLKVGLEQNIPLILAKAAIQLTRHKVEVMIPIKTAIKFGVTNRDQGWGSGLTILSSLSNLLSFADNKDQAKLLFHALSAVSTNTANQPPKFLIEPFPDQNRDITELKRWFRHFVAVFNQDAAARTMATIVKNATREEIADILLTTACDHRYMDEGHLFDFTNKALEALDFIDWQYSEVIVGSLVPLYINAKRMEDDDSWQDPVNIVSLLTTAFEKLEESRSKIERNDKNFSDDEFNSIVDTLLHSEPEIIVNKLLEVLINGISIVEVSKAVAYSSVLRIVHFHTVNEISDWDETHHVFTFTHAVFQAIKRVQSVDLLRAVFDGTMQNYLNRYLNIPAAPIPKPSENIISLESQLDQLSEALNKQQAVKESAQILINYLSNGGSDEQIRKALISCLLREDRNFHSIQIIEAIIRFYDEFSLSDYGRNILIAGARFLASQSPSRRSQNQTFTIAEKLMRGDKIYESDE